MPPHPLPLPERLLNLLADRALQGLSPVEEAELAELLRAHPEADPDALDGAAAAAAVAYAATDIQPVPADLAARLKDAVFAAPPPRDDRPTPVPVPSRWSTLVTWSGWMVAAAALVLALGPEVIDRLAPADPRDRFLARGDSAISRTVSWTFAPPARNVSGDLLWDTRVQEGFLRIVGLPPNDPARQQYQIWVIDPEREDAPVDGGVFDVPASGEATVIFRPARPVPGAKVFAVTLERAGGVSVSRQPRIAVATLP
jgi:anti-sigma-K factor RskA